MSNWYNKLPYRIYSSGNFAGITINVNKDDYLLSHDIKLIRIPGQDDYIILEKKKSIIKDCLSLVNSEIKKL
jgi:hypothetical protein